MAYRHPGPGNPPHQFFQYTNIPTQFQQQRSGQRTTTTQPQVFTAAPVARMPHPQQAPQQQRQIQTTSGTHFQPPPQAVQPYDQFTHNVATRVMGAIVPLLEEHHRLVVGRVDKLESSVRNTAANIEKQFEVANLNIAKALQAAHNQQRTTTTNILSQVKQLNDTVGMLQPLVNQVDMTVTELYERVNDREAEVSDMAKTIAVELGIDPSKTHFQDQKESVSNELGHETLCSTPLNVHATMQQRQSQPSSIRVPSVGLSPARWPSEVPSPDTNKAVFRANLSPEGRRPYSVVPETPPDGTISSLRRVSLGGDPFLDSDIHVLHDLPMTPPPSSSAEVDVEVVAIPESYPESPDWGNNAGEEGAAEATTDLSTEEADAKSPSISVRDELQVLQMIDIPTRTFTADLTPSPLTPLNSPSPIASPAHVRTFLDVKVKEEALKKTKSTPKSPRKSRKRRLQTENPSVSVSSAGAPPAKRAKKKPTSVPKKTKLRQWPEQIVPETDFVQCDECRSWYHIGCLGMTSNDPRLEDGVRYICLPCAAPAKHPRAGDVATTNPDNEPQRCGRPDCHQSDEVFIVERIIGKQTLTGGEGRKNMWLTKWFSYPAAQATWEDVEQTVTNASRFIDEFIEAAAKEGRDVDDNFYGVVLLQEAVDAGWRDE